MQHRRLNVCPCRSENLALVICSLVASQRWVHVPCPWATRHIAIEAWRNWCIASGNSPPKTQERDSYCKQCAGSWQCDTCTCNDGCTKRLPSPLTKNEGNWPAQWWDYFLRGQESLPNVSFFRGWTQQGRGELNREGVNSTGKGMKKRSLDHNWITCVCFVVYATSIKGQFGVSLAVWIGLFWGNFPQGYVGRGTFNYPVTVPFFYFL